MLACAMFVGHASALEYTMGPPDDYLFGKATSMDEIHLEEQPINVDRSKNTSLIPPGFGSPTSYLPGSGEYLTPNLVPGAFSGGITTALNGINYPGTSAGVSTGSYSTSSGNASISGAAYGGTAGISSGSAVSSGMAGGTASGSISEAFETPTSVDADGSSYNSAYGSTFEVSYTPSARSSSGQSSQEQSVASTSQSRADTAQSEFRTVTRDLYYADGHLGTLSIPAIKLNVKVYEGTDSETLALGAGHFPDTSIWGGNVCVAGHNRGANCYFGNIHTLNIGDEITLSTKLGTRTYAVQSVEKIGEIDSKHVAPTSENCITLFTCVRDESEFRWCVRAVEKA